MSRAAPARRRLVPFLLALFLLGCLLVLSGCGLPLPEDVQRPGAVAAGSQAAGDIRVLPPGPRGDSTPEAFVEGFLAAQSSPDNSHAIAREFLAPGTRWDDGAGLMVYDPAPLNPATRAGDESTVVVTANVTGEVRADGSYDATPRLLRDTYSLRKSPGGLQLVGVPPGLRLAVADRDRSFAARNVFFLAPSYGLTSDTPHLVADRVFLNTSRQLAQSLVEHLLNGPSSSIAGAVESAVPTGSRLLAPVTTQDGTTTVSLSGQALALGQPARAQLSAQLVWTLRQLGPEFQRLQLLSGGQILAVGGHADPQDRTDWAEYDPDGIALGAPLFYVDGGALRSLAATADTMPRSSAATDGSLRIVEAAVSPSGGQLGLLTARGELRIGPRGGPFPVRLTDEGLSSPSWGSGEQGLWVLRKGLVVLVPGSGVAVAVPVVGAGSGPFSAIRVSRDGARVALVADRRLWVGRIEKVQSGLRIGGLHEVAPGLAGVTGVAWESGTTLVVLARFGTQLLLPVRVAVDGSVVVSAGRAGVVGTPTAIAAAPGRPLVLAAFDGARERLLRDDGRFFQTGPVGAKPVYPG